MNKYGADIYSAGNIYTKKIHIYNLFRAKNHRPGTCRSINNRFFGSPCKDIIISCKILKMYMKGLRHDNKQFTNEVIRYILYKVKKR